MSDPDGHAGKIRVLFVNTPTLPPLGADTWIHAQIMRHLDRSTVEMWAACPSGAPGTPTPTYQTFSSIPDLRIKPIDFGPELHGKSVPGKIRSLAGSLRVIPSVAGLIRFIRRHDVHLIHTSDRPRDALASVILARLTGAKCIVHVHVGFDDWMSPLLKWSLRHADALIAVSEFVKRTLVDSGHDPARIHVVLNAIDPAAWEPGVGRDEMRRELDLPVDADVVITVCRLFPSKGVEELVRALPALHEQHLDARLIIVGNEMVSGFRQHLVDVATELGVTGSLALTGHRGDIARLMAAGDVFAMPSVGEPFGLVYLEAMAMRLPVVALDSGGTPEVVVDGLTGLLSRPGDTESLHRNLAALLGDPTRRSGMGAAGRKRVEARFMPPRMAADVVMVYKQLISSM